MVFYLRRFTSCITHTIQGPLQIGTRVTNVDASKVQDCMVYHGQYTVSKSIDCIAYELYTLSSYTSHTDMHDTKMVFIKVSLKLPAVWERWKNVQVCGAMSYLLFRVETL